MPVQTEKHDRVVVFLGETTVHRPLFYVGKKDQTPPHVEPVNPRRDEISPPRDATFQPERSTYPPLSSESSRTAAARALPPPGRGTLTRGRPVPTRRATTQ